MLGAVKDTVAAISPWNTQVVIHNQCNTPVLVFLAHNPSDPRPEDAHEFEVPPSADFAVHSGWLHEPRATLLLRTGLHEAKCVRAADNCRLTVSLAVHGLSIESNDGAVTIEDFADAAAVRGNDTVPMVLHGEHFADVPRAARPPVWEHREHHNPMGTDITLELAALSPWNTRVVVRNQCSTPVLVFLAHDAKNPRPENAHKYVVPANTDYGISSGWLLEPRATLLIRTGLHEAKLIRAANASQITVSLEAHGLHIESPDDVSIQDYSDFAAVPNRDTIPMAMHGEHFSDVHPAARTRNAQFVSDSAHEAAAAVSPWNTQVIIHNQCATPVLLFLAHDAKNPRPEYAHRYVVPPNADYGINSGWLHEHRATLLIRTGLREAKLLRAANASRITVSLAEHGIHVESEDDVEIEDFADASAVAGQDTVPMHMHKESFAAPDAPPTLMAQGSRERPEAEEEAAGRALNPGVAPQPYAFGRVV